MTQISQFLNESQNKTSFPTVQPALRRPLVLIAEDHDDTRALLKTMLVNRGIDVLEASSGEDAVEAVVRERPDLILMDSSLPRLDGFEATRLIRCIGSLKQVPIVFLSGFSGRKHRELAFAAGGSEYLVKPLDLNLLTTVLTRFTTVKAE